MIDKVDDDALTSIFLACLEVADTLNPPISPTHPAFVITHVCRHWRQLALSTRALWQQIHVAIPRMPEGRFDNHAYRDAWKSKVARLTDTTTEWILRSGDDSPLSVKVSGGKTSSFQGFNKQETAEGVHSALAELVGVLSQTSWRWREMELELWFGTSQTISFLATSFLSLPLQAQPILRLVRVEIYWTPSVDFPSPLSLPARSILGSSSLRSLVVGSWTMYEELTTLPVKWSSLRHLEFRGYPEKSYPRLTETASLRLLASCPNLISCSLGLNSGSVIQVLPDDSAGVRVTLRFLEELTLHSIKGWHIAKGFASSLALPSLRKLSITGRHSDCCIPREYEDSAVCEFLEEFGWSLRAVTFLHIALTQDALLRCLEKLAKVVSLTLADVSGVATLHGESSRIDVGFLRRLIAPQLDSSLSKPKNYDVLCPMMEELTIPTCRQLEGLAIPLADLIQARRKVYSGRDEDSQVGSQRIARLKSISCNGHRVRIADVIKELRRRNVDLDGLSFTVRNNPY